MSKLVFHANKAPTVGIELELALVDQETMALSSSMPAILERVPEELAGCIKPELMQCYVEINTDVCSTISQAEADLREKLLWLEGTADDLGVRLLWSGTHPFSNWREQKITPNQRYLDLVELLQEMALRLVCFGLHVHVGVDSGDKAVMIVDRIMRHLPTLLALSCNSPWWHGRATGLMSHRAKIVEGLPTAGLPPLMRNWSEYVWLVNHLVETGFINTMREIWWDVRPHHSFGTVEVRVCDMPGNLDDCLAIAALIQCLVQALSVQIDEGTYQHDCHPMMVRQNMWRASRYGVKAKLVDPFTGSLHPLEELTERLLDLLEGTAEKLDCLPYLRQIRRMAAGPGWAERQMTLFGETGELAEVVRRLTAESRISATV